MSSPPSRNRLMTLTILACTVSIALPYPHLVAILIECNIRHNYMNIYHYYIIYILSNDPQIYYKYGVFHKSIVHQPSFFFSFINLFFHQYHFSAFGERIFFPLFLFYFCFYIHFVKETVAQINTK